MSLLSPAKIAFILEWFACRVKKMTEISYMQATHSSPEEKPSQPVVLLSPKKVVTLRMIVKK